MTTVPLPICGGGKSQKYTKMQKLTGHQQTGPSWEKDAKNQQHCNTAQNSLDNLPSHPPDKHRSSDDVYWRGRHI